MKLFQFIGGNVLIKKWLCLDAKVILLNSIFLDFGPCFGVFILFFLNNFFIIYFFHN